jgi:hypothetical protein
MLERLHLKLLSTCSEGRETELGSEWFSIAQKLTSLFAELVHADLCCKLLKREKRLTQNNVPFFAELLFFIEAALQNKKCGDKNTTLPS